MTTVATDGKSMASDSRATAGDMIVGRRVQKMWKFDDGTIVGFAGQVEQIQIFLRWFENEGDKPPPKLKDLAALILRPDGTLEQYEGAALSPAEAPAAIGTGWISAITAMDLGKSPAEAVKVAMKRDVHTGGRVQVLEL